MITVNLVERACNYQTFRHSFVHLGGWYLFKKIINIFEFFNFSGINNRFTRAFTNSFNRTQTETDLAFFVYREFILRFVYRRAQNIDPNTFTILHKHGNLLGIVQVVGHYTRHILRGIIGFQISRLVGNQCVTGGVRFVEGIFCKSFPVFPDFIEFIYSEVVFFAFFHKLRIHFIECSAVFFTHGFSQSIGFTFCKISKLLGQKHYLLLINRDSIGFCEEFFGFL